MIDRARIGVWVGQIIVISMMCLGAYASYQLWNLPSKPATYQHDNKPACECECAKGAK